MYFHRGITTAVLGGLLLTGALWPSAVRAQTFGVEMHNAAMPAAGGMAGVSVAAPQDLTSALNGNPATLTQFPGTQVLFGGGWIEPTFNLEQNGFIPQMGPPLVEPFAAKSTAPGAVAGNIGITQDLSDLGLPAVMGIGFITTAGGAADFRDTPASGGANTNLLVFGLPMSLGYAVSERLSVGATLSLGIAYYDGPFVGASGMTPDYALRGTVGANYQLTDSTLLGAFYQSKQSFNFDNALVINPGVGQNAFDVRMDLPQNVGFGLANSALLDGCLLIGVDVLYKLWDASALYGAVYDNQWVVQVGAQYTRGRYRLRAGYAWAQNPIDQTPDLNVGGVPLGDLPAVRFTQGLLAVTSEHRLTCGLGVANVLPGVDLDLMAGGMLRDREQLGPDTTTSIEGYWVGLGMTWRFGAEPAAGAELCDDGCAPLSPGGEWSAEEAIP